LKVRDEYGDLVKGSTTVVERSHSHEGASRAEEDDNRNDHQGDQSAS
jgi:hypothetical protein